MESVESAESASMINACTQDCANIALGAVFGENSSHDARQGVGVRRSLFECEAVAQSEDVFRTRLHE